MNSTSSNGTTLLTEPASDSAPQADAPRGDIPTLSPSLGRAGLPVKTSAQKAQRKAVQLPGWAVAASVLWVSLSLTYLAIVGGVRFTPSAIGAVSAGISTPLVVIWLIALLQMRQLEIDAITHPVRRQLAALLAPGATAESRVRRVTEALAEQAEQLRNAANVALEDSSAAMNAITRQSGELRRLSGEAMMDIGKVGKTAEQTLGHLREALVQVNQQTGTERERALALVSDLEKHIRDVLGQVDKLSSSYEAKLERLSDTSTKLEERTKILVEISDGVENRVDQAAAGVLGDLDRLEAAVAELGQRSAAIAHQLSRPVESLEKAAGHLDSNMRQSQEMLSSATRSLETLGDNALTRASSLVATLSDRISSMELVGAKLVSVGASAQADTGRYVSQIEAAAERVRLQAESGQQQMRQVLREFSQIAEQSLGQSDALVGRLRDGANQLASEMEKSEQRFDALADDIEARAARLREIGKDATGQMEEARLILDNAQDNFSAQLTRLGEVSTRLTSEIERAKDGSLRLTEATDTAADKTEALLRVSDRTSETLNSIATVLTEQKSGVSALADALNTQIETLTAALSNQKDEIRLASSTAGEEGEKTRAALQQQVAAIAAATLDMAGKLDGLQSRLGSETSSLSGMADLLDLRLTELVAKVQHDVEKVGGFGRDIEAGQNRLTALADTAQDKLITLLRQLTDTQGSTENAMEGVAARLVALRAELSSAEAALQQSGQMVTGEQERITERSDTLSKSLATTLERLTGMTGGLESAAQAMSAQGQAAGALIAQAEQQLLAAGEQLTGNSQTAEMALAGVGEEISRQQQQLEALRAQVEAVSSSMDSARARIEAGEQTVANSGTRARKELEQSAAELASAASSLQAQVREGVSALSSAESSFANTKSEMVSHTDQVDERIRVLQQDMTALQNILAGLTTKSDALASSLAQQAVQAELASGKLQNASNVADQSTQQLMSRMSELGSTAEQQQQALTRMSEALETAEASLRSKSEQSNQSLKQTLDGLAQAGLQADELIGQMVEKLRSAGTSVGSEASGAQSLMGEIVEALRNTASEFTQRVETAEQQMQASLTGLDSFSRQLGSETVVLQDNIHALSMSAEQARTELTAGQDSITSVGADVAKALNELMGEVERLGLAGESNAGKLSALAQSLSENTSSLSSSGAAVQAQQELLAEQLIRSQQGMRDMGSQVEGVRSIVSQMADHAAHRLAEVSALFAQRVREGEEMVGGATGRLTDLELRLAEANSNLEGRHASLVASAETSLQRLAEMDAGFARSLAQGEQAQQQLAVQAGQNERILTGLSQITQMSTAAMDEQAQQLARLAQQAASDSSRVMEVTTRIEQQQQALRHAADAAVAVLQSVQAQLHTSSEGSVSLIDAAEAKVSDVLVSMTERLVGIASQNDALMDQLRNTTERFTQATGLMHESTRMLGSDINGMAQMLQTRAADIATAGQQFDREFGERLASLGESQNSMQRYFTGFGQQLAELDTRTTGYLVDLDRRSQESFGRMQAGVDVLAALPEQLSATESMLATQVEAARQEIARLRGDLIEIGREMQAQVDAVGGSTGQLISNLQDASAHSRLMAEQIDHASSQMGLAAESAWQAIRSAVTDSTTGMTSIVENLADAEGRTNNLTYLARSGVDGLLERVSEMSRVLDTSLSRINENYEQLAKGGFNALSELTQALDASATRLELSTSSARAELGSASALIDEHQSVLMQGTSVLAQRLGEVRQQLEALRDGFTGLDARLEYMGPSLSTQQDKLEDFLAAVDRTLNQVSHLQSMSRDLAGGHLELAERVQENEARLRESATELEGKLSKLDNALSGAVLARLVQAAEHAQSVEGYLGRLTSQASKLDGALGQIKTSLEQDVGSLQQAEKGIALVAENTTSRMLEVSTALGATLSQLQKGGQLSHAGLMQTNEETQRLVVRLEQVRALIKNLMGGISTDLNEWQSDMRRRLTGIAGELASPAARNNISPLPLPSASSAQAVPPRVRVAASTVSSTSTQLTTEALHAVTVDLYRLLQAEVPELKRSLMPPAARRSPMTPQDARTYTLTLLEQNEEQLKVYIQSLYRQNIEFHQYVDRYLARYEAQYDVLARHPQGLDEAKAYRDTEVGRLYELIAGAIERRSIAAAREAV